MTPPHRLAASGADETRATTNGHVLQGLAEDLARWFFQQLIVALDFCHKKGIANRDIKLEVPTLTLATRSQALQCARSCCMGQTLPPV